jgi:poly-gamma-glutamate synthesis protein (capsule biosynthesis protein)
MKIHLVGDIMIGRSFNDLFEHNINYNIWNDTLNIFNKSNCVIGNLETTLTDSNNKWPNKLFNFKLAKKYSNILKKANISHVTIANNHILDYKLDGMNDTINTLDKLNITYTGAGINYKNASKYVIKNINSIKIGIVSFADHYDYWKAENNKAGINYIDFNNQEILNYLKQIKNTCDILILSIHYGPNYVQNIDMAAKNFFYKALKCGVDIVHGHSAHHILPIEIINGKYIFYSMGDFIDDYAVDSFYRNDLSFIAELIIENKKIKSLNVYPTKISIGYENGLLVSSVSILENNDNDYKYVMNKLNYKNNMNGGISTNNKKYKLVK